MSNETVTYSLEAVLTRIEGKIDNLQKDVNQKFETLQKDFNQKFDSFQKDVDQKFDKIDERLNKLEVGQAKLTEKVAELFILHVFRTQGLPKVLLSDRFAT